MNPDPGGPGTDQGWPVDVALVHYPVRNKVGATIGSAVTNLDLHDLARAGKTYGVGCVYVVTPYADQQQLVQEILDHWLHGHGAVANAKRRQALELIRLCADLEELYATVARERGRRSTVLATCAKGCGKEWSYGRTRRAIRAGNSFLLLFGTAWGLAPEVIDNVDGVLPPIVGSHSAYNHLSVRSAVSIILDRLLAPEDDEDFQDP